MILLFFFKFKSMSECAAHVDTLFFLLLLLLLFRGLLALRSDHTRMFLLQEEIKLINSLILAPECVFFW